MKMTYFISKNLAHPSLGIGGFLVSILLAKNKHLEEAAADLCTITSHHHVLEVGYGIGLGLKRAFNNVAKGSGTVHGVDISEKMFNVASRNLNREMATGKIHLHVASVIEIPYPDNSFDVIFHTNCFYFWQDMDLAIQELHRVLKPGCKVVTTLDLNRAEMAKRNGFMQHGNIDPIRYRSSLERNGFIDVYITDMNGRAGNIQAIFATAKK